MKTKIVLVISLLWSPLLLTSCCKDDSALYGRLKISYDNTHTWSAATLYLYSFENTDVVLKEYYSPDLSMVKDNLLIGNYILKKGTEKISFQIMPDRTTNIYYSEAYFRLE